jgi:multisubunit Na+/H+ antiporter MnhG subunit
MPDSFAREIGVLNLPDFFQRPWAKDKRSGFSVIKILSGNP